MLPAPTLPPLLGLTFGLVTALTAGMFYYAARRTARTLLVLLAWAVIQAGLALSGFYTVTTSLPPRLALALGPPLLLILLLLSTACGRAYLNGMRLDVLTLLHVVRLPVELVLVVLYLHRAIPRLMTFEGRNWDILMGLSSPLIYYLLRTRRLGNPGLIAWNFIGIGLLLNIVITAVLSAPSLVQRFAFEQPNVAILYFPFEWLPSILVPIVLLAHVAALRQLLAASRPASQSSAPLSANKTASQPF